MEWQSTESDKHKELIRQLAYAWASVDLPGVGFTYADYIKVLSVFLSAIKDEERTKQIFRAILEQAVDLDKSSLWVEGEIKFETLAHVIGREELLTLELKHAPILDDQTLDLYNERKRRFTSTI